MLTHELKIYPNREHGTAQFYAVQGESGARELRLDLCDAQGKTVDVTGAKALLYVIKPDRNVAVIECTPASNGKPYQVSCLLTLQAAACPGMCSMFLQVLTDTGELRYDNMTLQVFPSAADSVLSRTDFGPLAQLIQSAGMIDRLLKQTQDTADMLAEIIRSYTRELSPETDGVIDTGGEDAGNFESYPAIDTAGNVLFLDCRTWGSLNTKFSTDFCKTWTDAPLQNAETEEPHLLPRLCVGGEKFLCFGDDYLMWARIPGEGRLLTTALVANPVKTNVSPAARRGRYLNGKYWIFREQSGYDASAPAYPPVYFTGNGAEYVAVSLPDSQMAAADIAYYPKTGAYYMAGGYPPGTPNYGKTWILLSVDLTTWYTLQTWDSEEISIDALSIHNGVLSAYPRYDTGDTLTVHRHKIDSGTFETVKIPFGGTKFYTSCAAGCEVCSAALSGSGDYLAYTKDGGTDTIVPVPWPESLTGLSAWIAGFERRLVLTYGPYYKVYRMDLVGEDLAANLEKMAQEYQNMTQQIENYAGRKIVLTTTDPGAGSPASAGEIIFVYEEG